MEPLPEFRYHPDPVGTGSVVESPDRCGVCDRVRGYVYAGPVYSADPDAGRACPWCIADGSAARAWDCVFTDTHPWIGDVPEDVAVEVLTRTPGFVGWQQERWLAHCGDAARFLGPVGAAELAGLPMSAREALVADQLAVGASREEADEFVASLRREGMPTGYLFQCRRCETYLGYSDFT